jgi:hypothetical protein
VLITKVGFVSESSSSGASIAITLLMPIVIAISAFSIRAYLASKRADLFTALLGMIILTKIEALSLVASALAALAYPHWPELTIAAVTSAVALRSFPTFTAQRNSVSASR